MSRARRCDSCIRAHRACSKTSARDKRPCARCTKLGTQCVTTVTRSENGEPVIREIGYRIKLARAMFGGEPSSPRINATPLDYASPQKNSDDDSSPYETSDTSSRSGSVVVVTGKQQNLRPTSRENSIRRDELAGQLRVDLMEYTIKRFLSMAAQGAFWLPSYMRANYTELAREQAKFCIDFLELFYCSGKNPKSPQLGRYGELQVHHFVCLGAARLRGWNAPLTRQKECGHVYELQYGSIEECRMAANEELSEETTAHCRWVGKMRHEVFVETLRESKQLLQRDFLDHIDDPTLVDGQGRGILLSLIAIFEACVFFSKEDFSPIWTGTMLGFRSLLQRCDESRELMKVPGIADTIERIVLYDAVKAGIVRTVPELSDDFIYNLMVNLYSEPVARVTISIQDEDSIPLPKDREEYTRLTWGTSLALQRMLAVCAVTSRAAPISIALDILEKMDKALHARDRWLSRCSNIRRPGSRCPQCRVTTGPCSTDCLQAGVTVDSADMCSSENRQFMLFRIIEELADRPEFFDAEAKPIFWARWNKFRGEIKARVDGMLWSYLDKIVEPVSGQAVLDPSQKVFGLGLAFVNILQDLPGGIEYLTREAEASEPALAHTRKQQVKKFRNILVHSSAFAGLDNDLLDKLDAEMGKWGKPFMEDSPILLSLEKSEFASLSGSSPNLSDEFCSKEAPDIFEEFTTIPKEPENHNLVEFIVARALEDMAQTCSLGYG